jgi:hypothetical protein
LVPGGLMPEERELAAELLAAKYGTDEWNLGTRHAYQVTVSAKAKGGVVFLSADMEEGTMRQARIRGDFLASDQAVLGRLEQALAGRRPEEAQAVVQAAGLPRDVSETLVRLLSEASQEGTFSAAETDTDE